MSNYDFNLRGMLIVPTNKQQISFYLCVLDVPDGLETADFLQEMPDEAYPGVCKYSCSKDLSKYTGTATKTINLPMFTYTPYNPKIGIQITDVIGNTITGDPNKGKPPVIPLQANPGTDFLTSNIVVQSESPNFTTNYFVVAIASSKDEIQNYANFFASMIPTASNSIVCSLSYEGGRGAVAIIGALAASFNQFSSTQVGNGLTSPIDWSTIYPL